MFSARGVDEERLRTWIDEDLELRRDRGEMQEAMQHVRLQREQVEAAIRHSNNSSPGPDGIPYAAWRRLGDEAVDILFDAAVEMTEEDGFTLLGKVYSDFNASLLFFCLRKKSGQRWTVWIFMNLEAYGH